MNKKEIFTLVCGIIFLSFLISSFWWKYGFVIAIVVASLHTLIYLFIDDYKKEKRIKELEGENKKIKKVIKLKNNYTIQKEVKI